MKWMGPLLLLLALLAPLPVLAGNVYRCQGGDGVTTYANKRVSGAQCKLVGSYRARPVPRNTASSAAPRPAVPATATVAAAATASDGPRPAATTNSTPAPKLAATSAPKAAAGPRLVRGQVYAYVGKDGVRNYTSSRPAGMPAASVRTIAYSYMETCYACGVLPGLNFRTLRLNTAAFQAEIAAAARQHGVEEAIVRAIIHAESAFNPNALSRVGAQGLMQLMPATARRFGVADAFDASQNIAGGVRYLAWLLKRFNGDLTLAAAGYNAGEGAVAKYGGVPPYNETQRYVVRVGQLAERYRASLNPVAAQGPGGLSTR